ncbi:UDP-2,4-diacetamido-2,4,6-trideoxy-beta-L-altropyranose hydrolase, partial [Cupriavidus sp. AcVe19-6a]|uniref:UDP-2,4-diacetamido-2,4, 6-trideoxy-beta-L-altropyranose hydrolase n=1 Tax=Cupriavidus sp. AcVe19-6a TaxID=2821358 RepID=UPI001AEB7453
NHGHDYDNALTQSRDDSRTDLFSISHMKSCTVAFRVDASSKIGSGHVHRCLALASALKSSGANVEFICRAHVGSLLDLIRSRGFAYHVLERPNAPREDVYPWLGVSYEEDKADTVGVIKKIGYVDWLVIDHYGIGIEWERELKPYVGSRLVIDDLANRAHDCEVLLDQNLFPNAERRYASLVPLNCAMLLGPKYALLRDEFSRNQQQLCQPDYDPSSRIFVFFGGVDFTNETLKFLRACFEAKKFPDGVEVVVGAQNRNLEDIRKIIRNDGRINLHVQVDNIAKVMRRCNYAFGAGGTTNWERFALGLNASVTSVADNQIESSLYLQERDLIDYLGESPAVSVECYRRALSTLRPSSELMRVRSMKITALVDGHGTRRVAALLLNRNRIETTCYL